MGVIINGQYYKHGLGLTDGQNPTWKSWSHDRQREEHQRDLIQPFINNQPNPEFIEQYPEEAKNYGFDQR